MTYEEIIKYLKSYQELKYNIEFYRNKMGGLKAISYSQEEKGTAQQNTMSIYMQKIDDTESNMKEIELFIENNFKGDARLIVWNKFINNMTYKETGDEIGYTRSYCCNLLKQSLIKCIKEKTNHTKKNK